MDGILVIDKPAGVTSHDVVNSVRKIALTRKVGHSGTLDPFATGVLVIGVNQGTKALNFLKEDEKEYEATLRFGVETDTLDRDGRILKETPCPDMSQADVERLLVSFIGKQNQLPPKFSAIKKSGVPLYKLARSGVEVEVSPREIEIYGISLLIFDLPHLSFKVRCSSGTYVRSLARDIGINVGCGAYLESLRRTRSGGFGIESAVSVERLKEMGVNWHQAVIGLREALALPEVEIDSQKAEMVRMGKELLLEESVQGRVFMLTCSRELVAVAESAEGRKLHLLRVFNP